MPRPNSEPGVDLRRVPRIVFRKLGREDAFGQAWHPAETGEEALIEIDPTITKLKRLEIAIHEALHIAHFPLPEIIIVRAARYVAKVVWSMGYRADEELQNGRYIPRKD